jgi:two-component sensor histidine kinase
MRQEHSGTFQTIKNIATLYPQQRRAVHLNYFILVCFITLVFGVAMNVYRGYFSFAVSIFLFLIPLAVSYLLNRAQKEFAASHTFFITMNLFMFHCSLCLQRDSGLYLSYFIFLTGYALYFGFERIKTLYFYMGFSMVLFVVSLLDKSLLAPITLVEVAYSEKQFMVFALISFWVVGFMCFLLLHLQEMQRTLLELQFKKVEESRLHLEQALKDKEILLAEVYHRVKNNLAVISSMINLQMNLVDLEETRQAFLDCKNRINSMALIHQKFYQGNDFTHIDMKGYITELIDQIKYSYNIGAEVEIIADIERVPMDIKRAIPCGIILNELLSNSFKHAFKDGDHHLISVTVKAGEYGIIKVRVSDNGPGFSHDEKMNNIKSLGLVLIQSLADQLDASYRFMNLNGTVFELEIPGEFKQASS